MSEGWWGLTILLLFLAITVILFVAWAFRYGNRGPIYVPPKVDSCAANLVPACATTNLVPLESYSQVIEEQQPQMAEVVNEETPNQKDSEVEHEVDQKDPEAAPEVAPEAAEATESAEGADKTLHSNPTGLFDFCRGTGETDLLTDDHNCGECGHSCRYLNGVGKCFNGACILVYCEEGWGNCDYETSNGCEANLQNDLHHCGKCAQECPTIPHGVTACVDGECTVQHCDAGWANCDGLVTTGCESFLKTDASNCGTCGTVCPSGGMCSNGQCYCPSCHEVVDGVCTPLKCAPGYQCIDETCREVNECGHGGICPPPRICLNSPGGYLCVCPSDMTDCDGTCVSVATNPFHCGQCNHGCEIPNATSSCHSGHCEITHCDTGFGHCIDESSSCETNLMTSLDHCGACNQPCPGQFLPHARSTCDQGECVLTCTLGFANCNAESFDQGCPINLMTDSNHCGSCHNACDPTTGFVCRDGECLCSKGLTRCDNACVDTSLSIFHCGECNLACPGDMQCVDGQCEENRLTCGIGTIECGGSCVSTLVDPQNCGQCGKSCGPRSHCVLGNCVDLIT